MHGHGVQVASGREPCCRRGPSPHTCRPTGPFPQNPKGRGRCHWASVWSSVDAVPTPRRRAVDTTDSADSDAAAAAQGAADARVATLHSSSAAAHHRPHACFEAHVCTHADPVAVHACSARPRHARTQAGASEAGAAERDPRLGSLAEAMHGQGARADARRAAGGAAASCDHAGAQAHGGGHAQAQGAHARVTQANRACALRLRRERARSRRGTGIDCLRQCSRSQGAQHIGAQGLRTQHAHGRGSNPHGTSTHARVHRTSLEHACSERGRPQAHGPCRQHARPCSSCTQAAHAQAVAGGHGAAHGHTA
mmetsp:Transcript_7928/g.25215  ORF Transcript_7928/g.25215 Transcript_7928/m.25215 type:complete len:309 (-) Transcript_7928:904-1830(-)